MISIAPKNKLSPIVKVGTTAGAITVVLMAIATELGYTVSATVASAITVLITQALAWIRGPSA